MRLFRKILLAVSMHCSYLIAIQTPEPYDLPNLIPAELPPKTIKFLEERICLKHSETIMLGGLTNHNYLLKFENGSQHVLKIHNLKVKSLSEIKREIENQRLAYEIGIAPKVIFSNEELAVIEYLQPISPVEVRKADLLGCLDVIISLHDSKVTLQGVFNFKEKCKHYFEILKKDQLLSRDTEKFILGCFSSYDEISKTVSKKDLMPCHNDLNLHNFLPSLKGIQLIDWEDSAMNDPAWDISYFLLINFVPEDLEKILLEAYISKGGIKNSSIVKRVKLYRPFVLVHAGLSLLASASSQDLEQEELRGLINLCFQNARKIYFNQRYQDFLTAYLKEEL